MFLENYEVSFQLYAIMVCTVQEFKVQFRKNFNKNQFSSFWKEIRRRQTEGKKRVLKLCNCLQHVEGMIHKTTQKYQSTCKRRYKVNPSVLP